MSRVIILVVVALGLLSMPRVQALSGSGRHLENPVTNFNVVIMGDSPGAWIELLNGNKAAGFIYFQDLGAKPLGHLGGVDDSYVVMYQPCDRLNTIINLLRTETNISIVYSDNGPNDRTPFTFLRTGSASVKTFTENLKGFRLPN